MTSPMRAPVISAKTSRRGRSARGDSRAEWGHASAECGADELQRAGVRERGRGGPVSAIVHGGWSFVRGYLLRLGLLDGRAGLAIALLNARATYLRYRLAGQPAGSQPPSGASP